MEMLLVSAAASHTSCGRWRRRPREGEAGPAGSARLSHGSGGGGQTSGRARRWGDAGRTLEGGRESDLAPIGLESHK